jgi:radical SAM superfamily enzyme YgiQ (UPF0313 family)
VIKINNKIKLTLIQPNVGFKGHTWESLGMGYLSSYLKKNYSNEIEIEFYSAFFDSDETIINNTNDSDIVGFTCTSPQYKHGVELSKKIKTKNNLIVFGGPHASNLPDEVLKENSIDAVVIGEGEQSLLDIVNKFNKGEKISKEKFKSNYLPDINSIPFPDRNIIKNERNIQVAYKDNNIRITSILSSRGCPYTCSFCCSNNVWGRRIRFRTPENILDEFEYLVKEWKIDFIKFADDTFTVSKDRTIEFCKQKIERNIKTPYGLNAHVNTIDEEVLQYLSASNCKEIWYGVESGSEKILLDMHKHTNTKKVKEIFELTKKYNIKTRAYFLLGMPNETIEDIKLSEKLCDEIKPDIVGFTLLAPYPVNEYYNHTLMKDWDWSTFDEYSNNWISTKTLSNQDLKYHQKRLVDKYTKNITYRQQEDKKEETK